MSSDDQLLERLRGAVAAGSDGDGEAIAAEQVWAAAHGELDPEETARLAERAMASPEAVEAWRLAVELQPPAAGVVVFRPLRWRRVVLAAAALVVIGVLVPLVVQRHDGQRLRGSDSEVTGTIADGTALPRSHFVLRWKSGPSGSTYEVWVGSEDLATVFETSGMTATEVQVPSELLAELATGDRVLWNVTTVDPFGRRSTSETYVVRLADGEE